MSKLTVGGLPTLTAEYRNTKVEAKSFLDKTTGQKQDYTAIRHTFEFGEGVAVLKEYLPRGVAADSYVNPFVKGTVYAVELLAWAKEDNVFTGTIKATVAAAPAKSTADGAGVK